MESELNLTHEQMGNIASVYFFTYAIMNFVWGALADRIGPRKCMLMGWALIVIALGGMGFMTSIVHGFISYALSGIGAAALSAPVLRLISDWFGGKRKDAAIGIYMTGGGVLIVTTGFVVPLILASQSWRWCWWAGAAFALVTGIIVWFLLVDTPAQKGLSRLGDNKGGNAFPHKQPDNICDLGARSTKDVLRQGIVWNLAAIFFVWAVGATMFTTFAVTYLKELGWDTGSASAVMSTWGALGIPSPVIWGQIVSRMTKKYIMAVALAAEGAGIFLFLLGTSLTSFTGAAIAGFADMGLIVAMQACVGDYFHPHTIGRTYGVMVVGFGIGAIIGPSLGGAIGDATGSLYISILVGSALVFCTSFLALALKKPK